MRSTSRHEYPHSLSYHERTFTSFPLPPMTFVLSPSIIAECGLPMISTETIGSVVYSMLPARYVSQAFRNASLMSSMVASCCNTQVRSVNDPSGVGTRTDIPSSFPSSSGMTMVTAFAAPVVVGIIFKAAALPLLKSLCGRS